jgi:hypothetical protein
MVNWICMAATAVAGFLVFGTQDIRAASPATGCPNFISL